MALMQTLVVLASVVNLASSTPLPGEKDLSSYAFEDYSVDFGKRYGASGNEKLKSIFEDNLKAILSHNANPSKKWFMTVNEFTDMSSKEFAASYLGLVPDLDESRFVGEFSAASIEGLPDSVDWRNKAGVMTAVKNQGSCGSCWAFSVTETLESHAAIASGSEAPVLSAQQVNSCSSNPGKCGGTGGCGGNIQANGFNYTAKAGLTIAANWPYTASSGRCDQSKIKPCIQNDGYVKLKVNDYNSLMTAVATKGPIAISVAATAFASYGGGILDHADCIMNHAVQLVGYGTDKGTDYWLVRNSWGAAWGENGYIRVKRFGEGKEPTCVDTKPQDGEACGSDTKPRTYAGMAAILASSTYPTGVKKVGDCASPYPPSTTHYGRPPCKASEKMIRPYDGAIVCATPCNADKDCPTDKPAGTWMASPSCGLYNPSNSTEKVCILKCHGGFGCGKKQKCFSVVRSSGNFMACAFVEPQSERLSEQVVV